MKPTKKTNQSTQPRKQTTSELTTGHLILLEARQEPISSVLDARKHHHRQVSYIYPDAPLTADHPYVLRDGVTPRFKESIARDRSSLESQEEGDEVHYGGFTVRGG